MNTATECNMKMVDLYLGLIKYHEIKTWGSGGIAPHLNHATR